jgi:hypothetical protein
MPKSLAFREMILCLAALVVACACSSGGGETPGAAGAPVMAAGGALVGGMPPAGGVPGGGGAPGGVAGTLASAGGAQPSVPAGMLMCGGKLCKAGGRCNPMDGSCPAFLGGCFSNVDMFETCDEYCGSIGAQCAVKSCNSDGTATSIGYSWVSYPASGRASCQMSGIPTMQSFDACGSLIWLSPTKPLDDVIRCCCKG